MPSAPSRSRRLLIATGALISVACAGFATPVAAASARPVVPPHRVVFPTLEASRAAKHDCALPLVINVACVGAGLPLQWNGGPVQKNPAVYIVIWGWHGIDPSGEAPYQQSFFKGIGGSAWQATQTQYCDSTGVLGLQPTCTAGAGHVGNPTGVLKGVWTDETNPIPTSPDDAAIAAEAARAAAHFGNTTAAQNEGTQYIIDTPHGNSSSGFAASGGTWCSYHSYSAAAGGISYTDFPYISDAGTSCGQNSVNASGTLDGVSIVGGHEYAESLTDPTAGTGWTDAALQENGDKCAWITAGPGTSTDIALPTGSFPVQALWSDAANAGAGGCVTG